MTAFVVEDGTGLADATSYVSVAFSDVYLDDVWDAYTDAVKETSLMAATEYIDVLYGGRFKGYPLTTTQALEFPRLGLYDRYGNAIEDVPDDLKKAICRYAQLEADGGICTTSVSDAADAGVIKRKKVKAGSVESDIEYFPGAESTVDSACAEDVLADKMIKQYLSTAGSGVIRN